MTELPQRRTPATAKKKRLRFWNGRDPLQLSGSSHAYIAAYSKSEAVRLGKAAFGHWFSLNELENYWAETWGDTMRGYKETVTSPGAWLAFGNRVFEYVHTAAEREER